MKEYLKKRTTGLIRSLVPEHVTLAMRAIRADPFPWDMAAVQLDALQNRIRGVGYPQYLYGLLCAARTARAAKCPKFTSIEFGVAGGNGLVAMERHAATVEEVTGVSVDVVGFDLAKGMPTRTDPRDCPYAFPGGEFAMDEPALRARLTNAGLRLGDVNDTVEAYMKEDFAPIGFVSHDLDLYTSTRDSLRLFTLDAERYLPRITMYFDDLNGYPYTTVTGEWAAISDFNDDSEKRQIGRIHGLNHSLGARFRFAHWIESMFILHVFDHEGYNSPEETDMPALALG